MVFRTLVSVLFRRPLTFIIAVGRVDGWEELKWRQNHNQLMSQQGYHFSPHAVQLKPTIKAQISGRMAAFGISDVVTAKVYSEKTRMKKLVMMMKMIISVMNKSQETTVSHGRQKLTSAMKQGPEK